MVSNSRTADWVVIWICATTKTHNDTPMWYFCSCVKSCTRANSFIFFLRGFYCTSQVLRLISSTSSIFRAFALKGALHGSERHRRRSCVPPRHRGRRVLLTPFWWRGKVAKPRQYQARGGERKKKDTRTWESHFDGWILMDGFGVHQQCVGIFFQVP